jgi:hypothetical protein
MTSWAAGYLSPSERDDLARVLSDAGRSRELVWLSLEQARVVEHVEPPADPGSFEIEPSVIGVTTFREGGLAGRALGLVHPHGRAVCWQS